MPKVILEFNLPEEQEEFKTATSATDMSLTLWDFAQFLRQKIKYEELSESDYAVYESVREKLYEIANEHNVEIG